MKPLSSPLVLGVLALPSLLSSYDDVASTSALERHSDTSSGGSRTTSRSSTPASLVVSADTTIVHFTVEDVPPELIESLRFTNQRSALILSIATPVERILLQIVIVFEPQRLQLLVIQSNL